MPHAEISYSSDLSLDIPEILKIIETTIMAHDAGAGICKGRGYPTDTYHHSHVFISVSLLVKPHRDEAFSKSLLADLEQVICAQIPQECEFSLALNYSSPFYVTKRHSPD